jgi:hypothetical protein
VRGVGPPQGPAENPSALRPFGLARDSPSTSLESRVDLCLHVPAASNRAIDGISVGGIEEGPRKASPQRPRTKGGTRPDHIEQRSDKDLHTQDIRSRRRSVFALSGVASESADNHRQTSRSKIGVRNKMKHLKIAGLCLVSMLMTSMALAGTASAAGGWEVCREGATTTKYSEHSCLTAESGGKWGWSEVKNTEAVKILAMTLTLKDTNTSAGTVTVRCDHVTGGGLGAVGPEKFGRITEAKAPKAETECTAIEGGGSLGCSTVVEVHGANLPWQTELFVGANGQLLTKIENSGAGEPGWTVVCKTALGNKTDTCLSTGSTELEEVELTNQATKNGSETELLVRGRFQTAHKAKCSEKGEKSGTVEGLIAILKNETKPWGLRVS